MRLRRFLATFAAAAFLITLPACQPAATNDITVAFVTNNPADFWNIAEAGTRKASAEFKVNVDFRRPASSSAAAQKEIIDALVVQGLKGIAVSVIDPKNQTGYIDSIAGQTHLLCVDNDAPDSKRLCYVGTDNYEAGKAVGRLVKEAMPEGGTIVVQVGQREPLNARQRYQGVLDELAGEKDAQGPTFGKYTQHGDLLTDDANAAKSKENAIATLSVLADRINQGEKVCLVGLWAYNPPTQLNAVKEKNLVGKVKIVGFDEDRITLEAIQDGSIYGTVVQDPFNFGYTSVKLLAAIARGDKSAIPPDGVMYVDYRVVVKDAGKDPVTGKQRLAAKEFQKELEELMTKK